MYLDKAKEEILYIMRDPRRRRTLSVLLWGPPGVGKSQGIRQVADELGIGFVDLRLPVLNPVDLRGVPVPNREKGLTEWYPPDELPNAEIHGEEGILLLDEVSSAIPAVQVAAYQLVLDRRCGNYVMPDGWGVIGAGNRAQDRAVVYQMSSALANRFIHLEIEADKDVWMKWALSKGIDPRVMGYVDYRPDALFQMAKDDTIQAYPTPRSWEFVSIIIEGERLGVDGGKQHPISKHSDLIAGAVGEGAMVEFLSFVKRVEELPDPRGVLVGKSIAVPDSPDLLRAFILGLADALVREPSMEYGQRFVKWVSKIPQREFSYFAMKSVGEMPLKGKSDIPSLQSATRGIDYLKEIPTFIDWAKDNRDFLIWE